MNSFIQSNFIQGGATKTVPMPGHLGGKVDNICGLEASKSALLRKLVAEGPDRRCMGYKLLTSNDPR
ncbi:hypothetical protein [Bradyrhizobium sp. ORS 111]|uniref:hypothetical protein n=1 Tax=Bradyrhizobium sp. ORS 111 TaxID=1685958 RepID=UPI00389044E6